MVCSLRQDRQFENGSTVAGTVVTYPKFAGRDGLRAGSSRQECSTEPRPIRNQSEQLRFSVRSLPSGYLSAARFRDEIASAEGLMGRLFGFLSVIIVMAIGMYIYSKQIQSTSAEAGASTPQGAINITGVKTDLMTIASAERRYFATEGNYAALDDLISTNYITVARQRPPYSYAVEVSSGGFRVVATRSGENLAGTPKQLSVDENMEFQNSE